MKIKRMSDHTFYLRAQGKDKNKIETTLWAIVDEHGNTMYQVYSNKQPKI